MDIQGKRNLKPSSKPFIEQMKEAVKDYQDNMRVMSQMFSSANQKKKHPVLKESVLIADRGFQTGRTLLKKLEKIKAIEKINKKDFKRNYEPLLRETFSFLESIESNTRKLSKVLDERELSSIRGFFILTKRSANQILNIARVMVNTLDEAIGKPKQGKMVTVTLPDGTEIPVPADQRQNITVFKTKQAAKKFMNRSGRKLSGKLNLIKGDLQDLQKWMRKNGVYSQLKAKMRKEFEDALLELSNLVNRIDNKGIKAVESKETDIREKFLDILDRLPNEIE